MALHEHLAKDPDYAFVQLTDICGVDYPTRNPRFEVVYHLLSYRLNKRLRIKVRINENEYVPSLTSLYPNASWWEREVWDMYGLKFAGNNDLRRLLTDYEFVGHPLRKDFPLTGYVEVRYDENKKQVVYEPVNLTQAYRRFDFVSPWEGMEKVFLGRDKTEEGIEPDG